MSNKTPYQTIVDATESMARTMEKMEQNLKILNDNNILHQATVAQEHKSFQEKLQELTSKHWYLVLVAFILLAIIAGVKEAASLLPGR